MLIQSDETGNKLVTASRDVRLEYTWPEIPRERTVWPLAWDFLEACGAKQPVKQQKKLMRSTLASLKPLQVVA